MPDLQLEVRPAHVSDSERIQQLLLQSRRAFVRFGYEDLARMLEREYCFIADTGALLWGFICASVRQPGLAQLRGLGLINGWRVENGIPALLRPLEKALMAQEVEHLMHVTVEPWLTPPLMRDNFGTPDYIINFERAAPRQPLLLQHAAALARVRAIGPHEIGQLTTLDNRAFSWPWQLSSGELVKLMMTTARLVVIDYDGQMAGYACTDIDHYRAQIIRLAVDPAFQGMGLGRHLLADALDFAAFAQAGAVTLNTQWQNRSSQKLYSGFGFRAVGNRIPVMIKKLLGA